MKRIFVLIALFACFSFAICVTQEGGYNVIAYNTGYISCCLGDCSGVTSYKKCSEILPACNGSLTDPANVSSYWYVGVESSLYEGCSLTGTGRIASFANDRGVYIYKCQTEEEADSVYCGINPNSESCFTPKDTTTYGCRDEKEITNGGVVTYHRVVKFIGKTTQSGGVEWTDYEEKELNPMSCADVGYCEYGETQCLGDLGGWYGESSSSSSEINWSSSSVSCKQTGQFGNTCYFECDNGAVGQCEGNDGDCSLVSDCEWQMQSSTSVEPTSSASGQSASSENPDLQTIIENQNTQIEQLNYNNGKMNDLDDRLKEQNTKTDATNSLLSQIANNINKINNKTSIITNNTYNGTSSESKDYTGNFDALADSLGSISEKLSEMLAGDTGTFDTSAYEFNLDSLIDTSYTTYGDSLEGAYTSFGDTYKGIVSDSGAIGKFTDSLAQLQKKFNISPLSGSGTGCPAFLQQTYVVKIGKQNVNFDLNKLKICSPILGSKTPWDIARALLRALVAISCMWFLFKCATGAFNGDSD